MSGDNRHIERISFISMPRSGHHFIASNLQEIFGQVYCEGYACVDAFRQPIKDCPRQSNVFHLNRCAKGLQITKTHDFSLQLNSSQYDKAIVLVRKNIYASLISWFEFDNKADKQRGIKSPKSQTSIAFQNFVENKLPYIMSFRDKYLKQGSDDRILKIVFEDFSDSSSSASHFSSLIDFLGIDDSHRGALRDLPVPFHGLRDPRQFEFFRQQDMDYVNSNFWDHINGSTAQ